MVAKEYEFFGKDQQADRQIPNLVRERDWLPIPAQQLASGGAGADMGQVLILSGDMPVKVAPIRNAEMRLLLGHRSLRSLIFTPETRWY